MNIVIFGCDNSGKTTLSKTLDSFFGGYVHSPGHMCNTQEMKEFILSNIDKNVVNIFDRFPIIEEYCCGNVLRKENKFDRDFDFIYDVIKRIDLFVYCRPNEESICNWGTREQMSGVKENVKLLVDKYDAVYLDLITHCYPVVKYDFNINGKLIKNEEVEN